MGKKRGFITTLFLVIVITTFSACGASVSQPVNQEPASDQDHNASANNDAGNPSEKDEESNVAKDTTSTGDTHDEMSQEQDLNGQETNDPQTEDVIYYVNPVNFRVYAEENEENEQDETVTYKTVLLTFDDGPKGDSTAKILDVLDQYHAKSIWFISGFNYGWDYQPHPEKAAEFEKWVLEIEKRGHIIANHTWEHKNLRQLPDDKVRKEIVELNNLLEKITGKRPQYFRAPFGANSDTSNLVVQEENMQAMNWSVGSLDWELDTPKAIAEQTLSTMHDGANILFHDKEITAESLQLILPALVEDGYKFVLPSKVVQP